MLIKHLSEPWFSLLYAGKKSIEVRLDKGHFHELKAQDTIEFYNDDLGFNVRRKFCVRVLSLEQFESFESLLEKHLGQALPTVKSIEFGCQILNQYYGKESEGATLKKLAIKLERISAMVNVALASGSSC